MIPPLLSDAAKLVNAQKRGALGWFDSFEPEEIPKAWDPQNAERLRRAGFAFLSLPEGSLLALLEVDGAPPAVVLLGSEGDRRTVATSLEAFLIAWSKGETEISELDDEEGAAGRKALGKWLASKKVKAPKAKDFDFQAWLDGNAKAAPAAAAPIVRKPTATMKKLGPKTQKLASIVGLRADDPKAIEYVTKTLGKKMPQSTSEQNDDAGIIAPKAGVQMSLTHDVLNDAYPLIRKTAKSFVPYVANVWVEPKIGETVLGVPWDAKSIADVEKVLGKPTKMRGFLAADQEKTVAVWSYVLDEGAHTSLEIEFRKRVSVRIGVEQGHELEKFDRVTAGVFMGWAVTRGLLDDARLSAHASLLADVKKRKATGGALYDALGRGLWNDHLKADDDLRSYAHCYFHNIGGDWITADLKQVFGKRKGPYGHDEPKLDDPTWDAVDQAAPVFEKRFARWL